MPSSAYADLIQVNQGFLLHGQARQSNVGDKRPSKPCLSNFV